MKQNVAAYPSFLLVSHNAQLSRDASYLIMFAYEGKKEIGYNFLS